MKRKDYLSTLRMLLFIFAFIMLKDPEHLCMALLWSFVVVGNYPWHCHMFYSLTGESPLRCNDSHHYCDIGECCCKYKMSPLIVLYFSVNCGVHHKFHLRLVSHQTKTTSHHCLWYKRVLLKNLFLFYFYFFISLKTYFLLIFNRMWLYSFYLHTSSRPYLRQIWIITHSWIMWISRTSILLLRW